MFLRHKRKAIHFKKIPHHNPYREKLEKMEKDLSKTYNKLSNDLSKGARFNIIQQDNKELLMLLGECNFIARECEQFKKIRARKTSRKSSKQSRK